MLNTSPRVMVIDDQIDILCTLQELLELEGYHVHTASDGMSGLKRAMEFQPDIVILDMMMPKLSGFLVTERLREAGKVIPIVMMSGNDNADQRNLAMFMGVNEFVVKPFHAAEFMTIVRRLCPPSSLSMDETVSDTDVANAKKDPLPKIPHSGLIEAGHRRSRTGY